MSQENVEVVRSFTEAYIRGDHVGALSHLAPDLVYEVEQELPLRRPDDLLDMWKRWEADWERIELIPEEYIDAGDEVVLVVRYSGRARERDRARGPVVRGPHPARRQDRAQA